jgi:hypothetical protein
MKRLLLAGITTAVCFVASVAAAATTAKPADLPQSYLFTPAGKVTPLRAGATYEAREFPLPIRLTPPGPGWSGTQWKSGDQYFRGGGPPNFGWVHLARGSARAIPRGLISIMTAYARTPSVAATVNVLRTRGRGATYEDTSPVTLAGFRGIQFDGQIVGGKNRDHTGHVFIPFSARSHAAKYYPDEYPVYGDVFRVIVLDVRSTTVVVFIENVVLPAEQFPGFLTKAEQILGSLRFPVSTKGA